MRRTLSILFLAATVLACGGGGGDGSSGVSADPLPHGGVQYQTYNGGRTRIQFLDDSNAKISWRNMSGSPVMSTYTQVGQEVEVTWGETTASTNKVYKMKHLDECQLVLTERITTDGESHSMSEMYVKSDDRCRR